jgi:hypothetical protein
MLMMTAVPARAEWQLKPFLGVTFGGSTTFVDLEHASGKPNVVLGMSAALLKDWIGVEGDVGYGPGFFQSGAHLVAQSSVSTVTGNIIVTLPRRMSEYTLRPYFVAGAGVMRVSIEDFFVALPVAQTLPAVDIGGGATGFVTRRVGVSWELRCFRTVSGKAFPQGINFGREYLSFCRANMALAFRY